MHETRASQLPDMFDPGLARDPYPAYARLRRGPDVLRDSERDRWIIHRYADVRRVLRDAETFSSANASFEHTLLGTDGEAHDRVRRALAPNFSPAGVRQLRDAVLLRVTQALDALASLGTGDIITELAIPLPLTIVSQMLGLPTSDSAKLETWVEAILDSDEFGAIPPYQIPEYRRALGEHFTGFRAEGSSLVVRAFEDFPSGLTLDERIDIGLLLIVAGLETTTNLIGSAVQVLLRDPLLARQLRQEPDLVGPFIEEVLRHRSPIQRTRRRATHAATVGGDSIPADAKLVVLIGAANRDPSKFADADDFQPFRKPNDHLGFGSGAHSCLGLWLARMEATLAIQGLLQRFSVIEAAGPIDDMKHLNSLTVLGPARLDIAVHA
ncbi:MAG TPA: cytochrome P450 [Caulobacteraceae bacterium]